MTENKTVYISMERINFHFALGTWSIEKAVDHSTSCKTNNFVLKMCCFQNALSLWLNKLCQRERCPQKFLRYRRITKWFVNCLNLHRRWKSLICNVKYIINLQIVWSFTKEGNCKIWFQCWLTHTDSAIL